MNMVSIQALSPLDAFTAGYLFGTGVPLSQSVALAGRQVRSIPGQALAQELPKFMDDQATAVKFYSDLMREAQEAGLGERAVDFIKHARDDEQKHLRLFVNLYRALTGNTYEPTVRETRYANLKEGLEMAVSDELEAAEAYRTVYLRETNQNVRNIFFEAMTDEMEHATRFTLVRQLAAEAEEDES